VNEFTLEDPGGVELLKFTDFDMGSPGWFKHGAEMFHTQTKNIFDNGVSQATRRNSSRPNPSTGSLVVQNL
jgi:hypothetical protein